MFRLMSNLVCTRLFNTSAYIFVYIVLISLLLYFDCICSKSICTFFLERFGLGNILHCVTLAFIPAWCLNNWQVHFPFACLRYPWILLQLLDKHNTTSSTSELNCNIVYRTSNLHRRTILAEHYKIPVSMAIIFKPVIRIAHKL